MTTTIDSPPGYAPSSLPDARPAATSPPLNRRQRLIRGRPEDPTWVRPAFFGLLVATAVLYLWDLSASGYANSFYSAAAQAGSASWKAFFYGSSDAANSITVDKPPASLWFMAISVRIFGLSSFAILLPQALMGVGTVGVLYAAVRRRFSAQAGLLAGAVLALTPVATLMFRFNNPDALLMLVLTGAAYAVLRGIENGRTRWLLLAGALVGLGFLTKQLQAVLVLPTFGVAYLVAAPKSVGKRIGDLIAAFAAMIAAAGWWIAIVELVPAQYRPYVGGSQNNSILELTLGYNGFGRLSGDETGSVGGGGGSGWGETGIGRMFNSEMGGQIAWLIPAALILLVAGLWITRRAPRTDQTRAAFLIWGGWLLVTGLIFSFMQGIFHAYYTVALAPAIAALIGIGATTLWKQRHTAAMLILAGTVVVTALWSYTLLARSESWHPWIKYTVLITGLIAAAGLALGSRLDRRLLAIVAATAVFSGLAGPAAYSISTAATPHTGSIVSAGPTVSGGSGGFGGGRGGGGGGRGFGGGQPPQAQNGTGQALGGTTGGTGTRGGGGGGMGGLLNATTPSAELTTALKASSSYTWAAAAIGSNNASGYQLASELPVMAIGGFNGSDPSPTLAQFQAYVAAGQIHYFIGGSGLGGNSSTGGSNTASQISEWVAANYTATTIGGTTVYDLTATT
ncbi:MAG TPA: glycosyltransferase family 39 protein [Kineosporiaceae bacterium]|nr:glycosyltransferase family 39 protein [Kineosporiaceae bacterium]